ncbi:MAG: DDE-type integrase/transposase/recombinase [candidate division WOR-3 bacterium]|nr:DDE-type integrase/transposase/recombinase [candidate division WOR-3 bacterium]
MQNKLEYKLLNFAQVFVLIDNNHLTLRQGAMLLNYSYWHFTKLYHRYQANGLPNLFKKEKPKNNLILSQNDISLLKTYYLQLNKPPMSLLHYFLYLDYPSFPKISPEWMRKILTRENIYSPGERKKVFRKRFEAVAPGVLIQGDSCEEQWLPNDKNYYHLIAFIDDCSRFGLAAKITDHDTIDVHFTLLKNIIQRYGKFLSLYYDNDEKYSYIRHNNSRFFEYKQARADLQVVRALSELGIAVINTTPFDPCGKGKIERFLGTLKLQLPVWFIRYGVKTLAEANRVLEQYLRYYNKIQIHREIGTTPYQKFMALRQESKFVRVANIDLERIFAYRDERTVNRDNTVKFNGEVYQLERRPFINSYSGKRAEIRYMPGKFLSIYIDGEIVRYKKLLTITKDRVKSVKRTNEKVAIL